MNMSLASCLPDFGPADTPKTIEDHSPEALAARVANPFAPGETTAPSLDGQDKEVRPRAAGASLKSVVRHIKLVDDGEFVTPILPASAPVDIDALIKEEADKVRAEEAAKASAALAAALAAERNAHAEQRLKERAEWVETEASRLAEQIATAMTDMEERLSQSVMTIFTPFLQSTIREQALGELRKLVLSLLGETDAARIDVSGPADLIDRIRDAVAAHAPVSGRQIMFSASSSPDVRVVAGDTVCVTQLAAWNQRIESALATQ
ncbi:hypothetical protein [Pseudochelatococcus contaminans]|uniref:Uncharacterized protein n=1 Tax=Pseudochelatococcus contaminans TaxID=1538103 RepID=A0A7W5Z1K6_9HYPH|nr:hypothetical protein [Pseudochelatococcus contaminans]MBB3808361.1 hypothetical protein [Pseudochelatococcus contaminans]